MTGEQTWSVALLHDAVNGLLVSVFGEQVWIEGEIRNLKRSAKGHVYFDLAEPGPESDSTRPVVAIALFASDRLSVNEHIRRAGAAMRMSDGVRVRIRGRLNLYGPRSTLQVLMSGIDPSYTLGVMSQDRDRVLAMLAAEGLLERNATVPAAQVPLRVAIVTSLNSAAHADALDELRGSGLGFRVTLLDARTQGPDAPGSIAAALAAASTIDVQVVLLVRGGGARTDLAAFDTEVVARAIAASPVPVVTGIGHEIDRTVADDVAHRAHKTPTAAAASLVEQVRVVGRHIDTVAVQLPSATRGRLRRAEITLGTISHRAGRSAGHHLNAAARELDRLDAAVGIAASELLDSATETLDHLGGRVPPAGRRRLTRSAEYLDSLAARARAHDPQLAMARGWSITRGSDGRVLRSVGALGPGDVLSTTVADGTVLSEVVGDPSGAPQ